MEASKLTEEQMRTGKEKLRKEALERRNALNTEERDRAAAVLTEQMLGHPRYCLSEYILGFVPYGSEIDITEILQDALRNGKHLYLPKVSGEEMSFYKVTSLADLEEGYKGIREPKGDTPAYTYNELTGQKTLMLMPGVAFDSRNNRIGYGKGFYDRYLQDKESLQLRSIAVGFHCQLVEEIPAQDTDIRPCQVICV